MWLVDSGASSHIVNDKKLFIDMDSTGRDIETAGNTIRAEGIGTVELWAETDKGIWVKLTLSNTLFCPTLKRNLLSVGKIQDRGNDVNYTQMVIQTKGGHKIPMHRDGGVYRLITHQSTSGEFAETAVGQATSDMRLWHRRLGHISSARIVKVDGTQHAQAVGVDRETPSDTCHVCNLTKNSRLPFESEAQNRANSPLERVHCDLWGPVSPAGANSHRYALCIVDDFSRFTAVYTMKRKSDTAAKIEHFIETFGAPKVIRSDNGGSLTVMP